MDGTNRLIHRHRQDIKLMDDKMIDLTGRKPWVNKKKKQEEDENWTLLETIDYFIPWNYQETNNAETCWKMCCWKMSHRNMSHWTYLTSLSLILIMILMIQTLQFQV